MSNIITQGLILGINRIQKNYKSAQLPKLYFMKKGKQHSTIERARSIGLPILSIGDEKKYVAICTHKALIICAVDNELPFELNFSCYYLFNGCTADVIDLSDVSINTAKVKQCMFSGCPNLKNVINFPDWKKYL